MKSDAFQQHERFNSRMSTLGINPTISIADRHGLGLLAHATFEASDGEFSPAPCLMLNLCTAHVGRMRRIGDGPKLDGVLQPGTVAIALPNTAATGSWTKTQMLGIAVNLQALPAMSEDRFDVNNLVAAASQFHNDSLLSSVMTALWHDAEFHGLSGAFFEQGIQVLLTRLINLGGKPQTKSLVHPLNGNRLQNVLDFIESRLEDDIRISELAALTGQDSCTFTRSFVAAMRITPYAYFTVRRMEFAKQLLNDEQLSITEIAFRVGYSNPSKFSAAFRRICGMSPTVWRSKPDYCR